MSHARRPTHSRRPQTSEYRRQEECTTTSTTTYSIRKEHRPRDGDDGPSRICWCSPDKPHPRSDLDRYGRNHYFMQLPSTIAPPSKRDPHAIPPRTPHLDRRGPETCWCSLEKRHPHSDLHRRGHYFEELPLTTAPPSKRDSHAVPTGTPQSGRRGSNAKPNDRGRYRKESSRRDSHREPKPKTTHNYNHRDYSDDDEPSYRDEEWYRKRFEEINARRRFRRGSDNSDKTEPIYYKPFTRGRTPSWMFPEGNDEDDSSSRSGRDRRYGTKHPENDYRQERRERTQRPSKPPRQAPRPEANPRFQPHGYQHNPNYMDGTNRPNHRRPSTPPRHQRPRQNTFYTYHLPPKPQPPPPPPPPTPKPSSPNFYTILGITPQATAVELKKAALKMRVQCHPDKAKKPGMTAAQKKEIDDRAALVGQAADVLQDEEQRMLYDIKRRIDSMC